MRGPRSPRPTRISLTTALLLVTLVWLLVPSWAAAADRVVVRGPVLVSGPTPFPGGCPPDSPPAGSENAAWEPSLVVDPHDPDRLAAAWSQDGGLSALGGVSSDGGHSWRTVLIPGVSHCTGGPTGGVVNPWLAYGPGGTLYLATLGADLTSGFPITNPQTRVSVNRSTDLGASWKSPSIVQPEDGGYYDKPSVTADPRSPGVLYSVYALRTGPTGARGVTLFSKSTDGGTTWSPPQTIYDPGPAPPQWPHGNLITVLPDGTLLNTFVDTNISPYTGNDALVQPDTELAVRSTDGGRTWSPPITIAGLSGRLPADGSSEAQRIDAIPIPTVTLDSAGTVYAAWAENPSQTTGAIKLARSTDGGRSWSRPTAAAAYGGQAFLPALATDQTDTLGLVWYDTRHDNPSESQLTTDVWFAQSHDHGRSWNEIHLAGPFATLSSPDFFGVARTIGTYVSLASTPTGFDTLFTQAKPASQRGATSIYFSSIQLRQPTAPRPRHRPRHHPRARHHHRAVRPRFTG